MAANRVSRRAPIQTPFLGENLMIRRVTYLFCANGLLLLSVGISPTKGAIAILFGPEFAGCRVKEFLGMAGGWWVE